MKALPVFITAAGLACAPAAFPLPQDGTLLKSGTDYLEKTRGKRIVLEFQVQSSRTVGFLGEIGWVGLYEPGGAERIGISNFSGTPLKATIAAEPGVYDVYVLSQANAGLRKFIRGIDARAFQPGDIIPVTLTVTEGWDAPAGPGAPAKAQPAAAPLQAAGDTERRIEEAQRAAELRAAQRSRSVVRTSDDTERRIEEAQRAAELRAGRRPVETKQAASPAVPSTQPAPASSARPAPPSTTADKPASPTQAQEPQSAATPSGGASGTFSLKIFEGYRFSDGATVKSDDKTADIRFYYVMRAMGPYVYLGSEKISELPAPATRRFSSAETASWKDYVFGPAPGYFGVVSKGRHYLVRLETYENQGKAASLWKMNFSWQALD